MVDDLAADDKPRMDFLRACLTKLGLQVNQEQNSVPTLSRLHLSSLSPSDTSELLVSLQDLISVQDGEEFIKDENDTFLLEKPSAWSMDSVGVTLSGTENENTDDEAAEDRIVDYDKILKRLMIHEKDHPASKETPYFNHEAFFASLKDYQSKLPEHKGLFGKHVLYGEVVTSTNTMLEKCITPTHPKAASQQIS